MKYNYCIITTKERSNKWTVRKHPQQVGLPVEEEVGTAEEVESLS